MKTDKKNDRENGSLGRWVPRLLTRFCPLGVNENSFAGDWRLSARLVAFTSTVKTLTPGSPNHERTPQPWLINRASRSHVNA